MLSYWEMQIGASVMPVYFFMCQRNLKLYLLDFCDPHYDYISEANMAMAWALCHDCACHLFVDCSSLLHGTILAYAN